MFDKKAYDREYSKKHSREYILKHSDKYLVKKVCETCGGNYQAINEKQHLKTKKHLFCENLVKKETEIKN